MGPPPVTDFDRRRFLSGVAGAALVSGCRWKPDPTKPPLPPGDLGGPDFGHGHRLRSGGIQTPSHEREVGVAIVGAGVAGLGCGWHLARNHRDDFEIFELETVPGGNSRSGRNRTGPYPVGAHYLPIPSADLVPVRQLLSELDVLQGDPAAARPTYHESHVCAAPQERIFAGGRWHEGLIPDSRATSAEREAIDSFHLRMERLKSARGVDGRLAFAFPMRESSRDPVWTDLDKISFKAWMEREGFLGQELSFHADYACRDDYGTKWDETSAWAGIHYFAARRGKAANAEDDAYLTRPEGNSWLIDGLRAPVLDKICTGKLVFRMETESARPFLDTLDVATGTVERIHAKRIVWASPIFELPHVWRDMPDAALKASEGFSHTPWVVANLELSRRPLEVPGAEPAWDNVLRDSDALGYVVATHQTPRVIDGPTTFTWYKPCCQQEPVLERSRLLGETRESIAEQVLSELETVHPDIRECCTRLDVWRWGHAMIKPTVGFVWHSAREWFENQNGQILFAHSDLSGMSLFEEALCHGVRAADRILLDKIRQDRNLTNDR
jgi:protoporphyrinogen oxidase